MKSIRIYQAEAFEINQTVALDKNASNHLLRVLRLKSGQSITLFNGNGGEYLAILQATGKNASVHIQSFTKTHSESPLKIHLLQGISKAEHMDIAIQKSIELGVNKITPLICQRSVVNLKAERAEKKRLHWQNIAISACEQSGRNFLPDISPIAKFATHIGASNNQAQAPLKLLLDPLSSNRIKSLQPDTQHLCILIGPEGGLSESEIKLAQANGFIGIQFGPRILRTETAALAAIANAQLLWGDLS